MEPADTPLEMPQVLRDLTTFINRWPAMPNVWQRFRVALTTDEIEELRQFFKIDNGKQFVLAIRGVPILIEEHPLEPRYYLEFFNV